MRYETNYEAHFAARYAARYCERIERFYRRIATFIAFLEILVGSGALLSLFVENLHTPIATAYIGLLLTALVAARVSIRPEERAADEKTWRGKFMGLIEESKNITLEEFNSRLTKLSAETLDSIEALRSAAYNDVIKELNRDEYAIPLSNWQRLISWLA